MEKQIMQAQDIKEGMWLVYSDPAYNERVTNIKHNDVTHTCEITCSKFDDNDPVSAVFDYDEILHVAENIL